MSEFLPENIIIVYFVYGLAFLVMGLTVALESLISNRFRLVPGLWLLAAFGILHGLSEWIELLIAVEAQFRPLYTLQLFVLAKLFFMAASFVCLIQFGVGIFLRHSNPQVARTLSQMFATGLWLLFLIPFAVVASSGSSERYLLAEIAARYSFGFPGGLLASYALTWQGRYYRETGRASLARGLYWGAIGFASYAFAEGAIGPEANFWPASQFNESVFQATFGAPIEAVRAFLAVLITVFMTKTFVVESRRALETAHQFLATLNESMKAITSSLNLDAVLNLIIQQAAKAGGARWGILLLAESNDQELLEKARYGDWTATTLSPSHPTCQYLYSRAKELGKAVLFDNRKKARDVSPYLKGQNDPAIVRPGDFANTEGGKEQLTYLCVPIEMSNRTMGAILLARQQSDHAFSEEDVQFVTALAAETAVAIENARLYQHTWEMTITDALTGLRNYRYLHDRLQDEVARAGRYSHPFSIIAADCDSLKIVNDRFGHIAGDQLLRGLAEVMRGCVRSSDIVTRQSGDEFVILMPETTLAYAINIAERMRLSVEEFAIEVGDERVNTTMSFGVATFPDHAADAEDLLRKADQAMYRAKTVGKNGVAVWEESGTINAKRGWDDGGHKS